MVLITDAGDSASIALVRVLFEEYQRALGVDLAFQGFPAELATLPGDYSPPRGRLLLARDEGAAIRRGALRPLSDEACEMKRLYVRPHARAAGLGRRLAERLIAEARTIGYRRMLLDT